MADRRLADLSCGQVKDLAAGFVLGALEADEMAAVRRHLASCPEAHEELAQLGSILPALLESVEIAEPPVALRSRMLDAARAASLAGAGAGPAAPELRPATTRPAGDSTPVARPRWFGGARLRPAWTAVGLAAVLAALALGSWNLQLRSQVDALSAYRDGVVEVLDVASAPGGQLAVLTAPDGATAASGIAGVGIDGRVAVVMRELAPTSGSQVYEVWLVGAGGTPLPIGGFAVGGSRTAAFTARASGTAGVVVVALTLEPGPGAMTPTEPLVALGTARPSG